MADKPSLTLAEGASIGVAEIVQLYQALTGKSMTAEERNYAEQTLAASRGSFTEPDSTPLP